MKDVKLFVLEGCPYCRQAYRALEELKKENPAYESIDMHTYEEHRDAGTVAQYEYYYAPAMFIGEKKVYEAHPGESYAECRSSIRAVLDAALSPDAV